MIRCCGKNTADVERQFREMRFPMWVLPVRAFLEMAAGPLACHQQLLAEGRLVQWTLGMFVLFVSHQWVGRRHCDPNGEQMAILRSFLRAVIDGTTKVQSGLIQFLIFQRMASLSPQDRQKIANGYIWLDWASIPQLTMRVGDEPSMEQEVQNAIESIPAYADASDMFMVLCPPVRHVDTMEMCSRETWERRGWCRLEMAAAVFSETQKPLVMISSASSAFLMFVDEYLHTPPGKGQFTEDSDRSKLLPVMEGILDKHLEVLWSTPSQIVKARLITALRGQLLSGLGSQEPLEIKMEQFLKDFRFDSPTSSGDAGFGPVHCAAAAGNLTVLRELVAARADVNHKITRDIPELRFVKGSTPLLDASRTNGDVKVIECLMELRADVNAKGALGHGPIEYSLTGGNLELMKFWLDFGMDMEHSSFIGDRPLIGTALLGESEGMKLLLERRADINSVTIFGNNSLMTAVLAGRTECCRLLLEHGADARGKCWPHGFQGEAVSSLMRFMSLWLAKTGPVHAFLQMRGRSPLEVAYTLGFTDIANLLEQSAVQDTPDTSSL